MATVFNDEQAYNLCKVPLVERSHLRKWAGIDPHALASRPDLLEQCLYWQDRRERYIQSPPVQKAYTEVHPGLGNPQQQEGMSIHDAARRGLYAQQPAQQPARQAHRGAVAYIQQSEAEKELKAMVKGLKRASDEVEARLERAVRSQAKPPQTVNRKQKAMVTRGEVQQPLPAQPDYASMPPLPLGTDGKPSLVAAQTRVTVGLEKHPILNYAQFYQDQFLNYQLGNR